MLNLPNHWSKMQAVYRCGSYFSWVSEFWLALPALIGREFLKNLWFKDEAGGDSPIVHILFFSLQRSTSKWNIGKCSERLLKMLFQKILNQTNLAFWSFICCFLPPSFTLHSHPTQVKDQSVPVAPPQALSPAQLPEEAECLTVPKYKRDLVQKLKTLRQELSQQQPPAGHCRIEVCREEIFEVRTGKAKTLLKNLCHFGHATTNVNSTIEQCHSRRRCALTQY